MVTLNGKQLTAITRFNREFSVKVMTLEEAEDSKILVRATLNTKSELTKIFYLDSEGGLAGIVKGE